MSRATKKMRQFAANVIALEMVGRNPQDGTAAFIVCEKLRSPLSTLMGTAGFRSLVGRALTLTHAEVRWLKAVHVKADGSLTGLKELQVQVEAGEFQQGGLLLV